MSKGAIIFMALSWAFVLGLTFWAFARLLRGKRHFDPDGIGPASPPEPGRADPASGAGPIKPPPKR
jgi:hypothetical protein